MNITELCARIGPENILVQPLNESITGATYRQKLKATEVKFVTNQFSCGDLIGATADPKIGLILWIPKRIIDSARQAIDAAKEKA